MKASRKTSRYGIAEWFGKDLAAMTPEERQSLGQLAMAQQREGDTVKTPVCPFLSTLIPEAKCNKSGGVCSIRKYYREDGNEGSIEKTDKVVTVCPSRFLEPVSKEKSLFAWISEKMLDISNPVIVKETPFLRKITDTSREADIAEDMNAEAKEEGKKAGRIDWILVNPATMSDNELEWCAVETQALYFSGGKMNQEFEAYAASASPVLFPAGKRRPDYRSSGPKRLAPQLDVKVPVLRNWGKKVVVVIDRYFYENMNSLADAYPRAKSDKERRDNAEIVWFIVDYDENLHLKEDVIVFTTLDSSRTALNATEPLSKSDFTRNLKTSIESAKKSNKVFSGSK